MNPVRFDHVVQLGLGLACLTAVACKEPAAGADPGSAEPSPNASILPSPLASARPLPLLDAGPSSDAGVADASGQDASEPTPPSLFEGDRPPRADTFSSRETTGAVLQAHFTWEPRSAGGRGDPRGRFPVRIELAAIGRMRFVVESERMPLGPNSELRARVDRYGHLLLWPEDAGYRVLSPGTLRALFQELRADTSPLQEAKTERQAGGKVLGLPVQVDTIRTSMGTLVMEQAEFGGLGGSGALLCRLLLEFVLAKPENRSCAGDWLPLKAEFGWADGGRFGFLVNSAVREGDLKPQDFSTPAPSAGYRERELPDPPAPIWADAEDLARILPGARHKASEAAESSNQKAPTEGLVVLNRFEAPRYLLLNGELVAWLGVGAQVHLERLRPGGYALAARDLLGVEAEQRLAVNVPGRATLGRPATAEPPR